MRLQFHKGFTFDDAVRQVSYLAALDVSHLYASPIMTARAARAPAFPAGLVAHRQR
jgi:(1->4)-alpha-D-glucan 1-alpha-D-glucosylmutase